MSRFFLSIRCALRTAALAALLAGPVAAEDDLPSWDSREAKLPPWKPAAPGASSTSPTAAAPKKTEDTTAAKKEKDKEKDPEAGKAAPTAEKAPAKSSESAAAEKKPADKPVEKTVAKAEPKPAEKASAKPAPTAKAPAKPAEKAPTAVAKAAPEAQAAEESTNITNVQAPVSRAAANSKLSLTHRSKGGVRSSSPEEDSSGEATADAAGKEKPAVAKSVAEDTPSASPSSSRTLRYVVKRGDTLWDISRRFKMTVDQIKLANGLKTDRLDPGQVLLIPVHTSQEEAPKLPPAPPVPGAPAADQPAAPAAVASADPAPASASSGEASEPEAVAKESGPTISVRPPQSEAAAEDPARPSKRLITRAEPGDDEGPQIRVQSPLVVHVERKTQGQPPTASASISAAPPAKTTTVGLPRAVPPLPKPEKNSVLHYANKTLPKPVPTGMENVLTPAQKRLVEEARALARRDIGYNRSWRPPGEKEPWRMDCSNTARYLYKRATGISIERTASSQYYVFRQKGRCWNVPLDSHGNPDLNYLARNLRVGDLLFWENTYKPVRTPPITHVTVFLGTDKEGRWLMFGSQSGEQKGLISDDPGGPDLYVFDPLSPSGGYRAMLGFHEVKGRFVAHARPLPESSLTLARAN